MRDGYNASDVVPKSPDANGQRTKSPEGLSKYQLEDYIYEMECRQEETDSWKMSEADMYTCLAQKERDLVLAAELGKALLERNEILVRENERQAEEYSHQLEELEQEKHILRRKLVAKEGEFEVKIQELTCDLNSLRSELETEKESVRETDREKSQLIEELTAQNQRLTTQLREAAKHEEFLNQQLELLRNQFNMRKSTASEHFSTLEVLREEINLLNDKKLDLERRVEVLVSERENLSINLDESSDRIQMLEKQSKEQELLLRHHQRDMDVLRHTNLSLTDRLEAFSRNSSPSMGQMSLMNEIDMSDQEVSRPHSHPSLPEDLIELDEDIECDEPVLVPLSDSDALKQLRLEVVDAIGQLRVLVDQMRHRRRNSLTSLSTNSSDEVNASNLKAGTLLSSVKEIQGIVRDILRREAQGQCCSCGKNGNDDRIQLEQDIHRALETVDKLTIELCDTKEKLKITTEEATGNAHKVTLKEAELKAVQEEKSNLKQDLENTHLAKDEIVKKAWDSRDNAVVRKNACEIELAKTRIEVMQISSQLIEAVQQKVELSQQLDQWQLDMQVLLEEQMKKKMDKLEGGVLAKVNGNTDSDSSANGKLSPRKTSRLFTILSALRR